MSVEEERQLRREVIDVLARIAGGTDVGDAVGQGERDLLGRRASGFADVIAGDRNGVPARRPLPAKGEGVGDEPHGRRRRVDVGAAGDVLLQDVVLYRAGKLLGWDPLALRHRDVEAEQDGRGGVDGHRGRDAIERDPLKELLHVEDTRDRHTDLARFAPRHRVVGVIAHLRRQVKRHAEPALALGEQIAEALVGLAGGAKPRVLPHGPEAPPVPCGLDAARVRKLPWESKILEIVEVGDVRRRHEALGGRAARSGEERRPLRRLRERRLEGALLPRLPRVLDALSGVRADIRRRHSGMFPCFFGGFWSRLVPRISSAWMSFLRVSRGSMTSSM